MKKSLYFILLIITVTMLTGCEKQVCSYCGETKYCEEYKILDSTRYICKECMNNPAVTISSNVVNEYQADPLDESFFGVGSEKHNTVSEDDAVSDNQSDNNSSSNLTVNNSNTSNDNNSGNNSSNETSTEESNTDNNTANNNSNNNNNSTNTSNSSSTAGETKETIVNRMISLLSNSNLILVQDSDNASKYIVKGNDDSNKNVILTFDKTSSGKISLNIAKMADADNSAYTNACISASLAFINSTDYSQTGYEIFTSACQYGNYTKFGCRFYYMDNSDNSNANPAAEYDISYQ